jgi:hypothetical protein
MAGFFTFDRTISTIASEFKPNAFFGNAFSEIFSEKNFDHTSSVGLGGRFTLADAQSSALTSSRSPF